MNYRTRVRRPPGGDCKRMPFLPWAPDAHVCGEAVAISYGNRHIELISTRCSDGTYVWINNDGLTTLGLGDDDNSEEAMRATEAAAHPAPEIEGRAGAPLLLPSSCGTAGERGASAKPEGDHPPGGPRRISWKCGRCCRPQAEAWGDRFSACGGERAERLSPLSVS
jgi:hypothetical protein